MSSEWQKRVEARLGRVEALLEEISGTLRQLVGVRDQVEKIRSTMTNMVSSFDMRFYRPTGRFRKEEAPAFAEGLKALGTLLEDIVDQLRDSGRERFSLPSELDSKFGRAREILGNLGRQSEDTFVRNTLGIVQLALKELQESIHEGFQKDDRELVSNCRSGVHEISGVISDLRVSLGLFAE